MSGPRSLQPSRGRRGPPGEPLYTLKELAARLQRTFPADQLSASRILALMGHHPGLSAWHAPARGPRLYRLSDAVRWYTSIAPKS